MPYRNPPDGSVTAKMLATGVLGAQPNLLIGCIGDSISEVGAEWTLGHYLPPACAVLRGKIEHSADLVFAASGYTLYQMMTNELANAVASAADIIVIHGGVNGSTESGTLVADDGIEYVTTMANALVNAGKIVVVSTIMPKNAGSAAFYLEWFKFNSLIKTFAASTSNVYCADFAMAVGEKTPGADDDTPDWDGDLTADNTHPNRAGNYALGEEIASVLQRLPNLPSARRPSAADVRWMENPLMFGTGGTSGGTTGDVADGYATSGGQAGSTTAKVARTDGIPGVWQRCTAIVDNDNLALLETITVDAAGDYNLFVELRVDAAATSNAEGQIVAVQGANAGVASTKGYQFNTANCAGKSAVVQLPFTATQAGYFTAFVYPGRFAGNVDIGAMWIEESLI